ncbi:large ribosomal subunit protein mL64 [Narcine bancroftii]|uniref:large ribosomal subunit protein mL64 n=1 Tax=Narcine bancroftii TaxID=1343680 RepID=UPI00383206E1
MAASMLQGLAGAVRALGTRTGAWGRSPPGLAAACYHAKPLGLDLSGFYVPGPDSPEWQRSRKAERKRFGRAGAASGVPAASLWPSPEELRDLRQFEAEWQPSLQQMWSSIQAKEAERREKQRARHKLIEANMAKMPKMVEDWRREKRAAKEKQREEAARRERLLAEARERFGYSIDPRNSKFQEMVKEMEKEERKKKKLLKRQKPNMAQSAIVAAEPPP